MKAKRITVFLMALTLTVTLSACGNINSAQEIKESEVETEESKEVESEEAVEDETEAEEVEDVDEVEEVEAELEAEAAPVEKTETVKNPSETVTTKPAETAPVVTPEPETTPAPQPETTPAPTPEPTVEPTQPPHVHEWKEHMAETHVWVPNVVTVEDYETQRVAVGSVYHCNCGFETTDTDTIIEHQKTHCLNGEQSNFQAIVQYEDQQVLVGTHTEDQGHWETSTYVDYYYCECGARK